MPCIATISRVFQQPDGAVRERDYYLGLIADENVALLVAEAGVPATRVAGTGDDGLKQPRGENLVGFVHAIVRDAPAIPVFVPRRYAVVDSVVVRSGFQYHGIGRRLMNEAQEWAIAKGATSIELNVYEFNETAIAFYDRLGYQSFSRKMSKELGKDKAAG